MAGLSEVTGPVVLPVYEDQVFLIVPKEFAEGRLLDLSDWIAFGVAAGRLSLAFRRVRDGDAAIVPEHPERLRVAERL